VQPKAKQMDRAVLLAAVAASLVAWCVSVLQAQQPTHPASLAPPSRFARTLSLEPPSEPRLTGREFEAALRRTLSADWQDVPLRELLRRLEQSQRVAILLDRRMDPETRLTLHVARLPFLQAVEQVAGHVGAKAAAVGNVVYVGPPAAASVVRTLAEARMDELFAHRGAAWERQALQLARKATVAWPDLATPREILQSIAQRFAVEVVGAEQLPHDLWARAVLPQVNCAEALSLVLIQFDQTFRWAKEGRAVELVPVGQPVRLERTLHLPPRGTEKVLSRLRQEFPELEMERDGLRLTVRGTAEQIDAAAALLQAARSGNVRSGNARRGERSTQPVPLTRRQFTLRVENAPVVEVMKKLESVGVRFEYDADELTAAGIDLNRRVNLDVHQARGDQLIHQLFAPFPLQIEIHAATVTLKPR